MDINVLALAYIGDSIYEVYIRDYLIHQKIVKVNEFLHYYTIHEKSETTVRDERVFDILKGTAISIVATLILLIILRIKKGKESLMV